jgi:hypothetical protein
VLKETIEDSKHDAIVVKHLIRSISLFNRIYNSKLCDTVVFLMSFIELLWNLRDEMVFSPPGDANEMISHRNTICCTTNGEWRQRSGKSLKVACPGDEKAVAFSPQSPALADLIAH